jgi:hypothetical protein
VAGWRAWWDPFVSTWCCRVQLTKKRDHKRSLVLWCHAAGCSVELDCNNMADNTRSVPTWSSVTEDKYGRQQA